MYKPTLDQVRALAGQGNLIPIYRELPADSGDAGVGLSEAAGQQPVLPAGVGGEGRAAGPLLVHRRAGADLADRARTAGSDPGAGGAVLEGGRATTRSTSLRGAGPTHAIDVPGLPRFSGGAVGYLGYDWVRFVERLPETATDDLDLPTFIFLLADNLVIFDHVRHRLLVLANCRLEGDLTAAYADAIARIDQIVARLRSRWPCRQRRMCSAVLPGKATSPRTLRAMVRRAKEYIAAGDIFQVVSSQRLSRPTDADPFTIYRALRMTNPSPTCSS